MANEFELEVFKTGDYGAKGAWDAAALDGLAADYDPALHEAPVTLDHAQTGPALGWVAGLRRVGDRLVARLRGVNARLIELIRAGAFTKRSVEIYPKLRESGRPYLRAVSFLGAAAPEVKGLAEVALPGEETGGAAAAADGLFCEDSEAARGGVVEIESEVEGFGEEIESDYDNVYDYDKDKKEGEMEGERNPPVAFEALRGRLQAAGRWAPAWGERGIAEFFGALEAIDEVAVGEEGSINAAEWFARFLEELPAVVEIGEAAPARGAGAGPGAMALPRGGNVDAASVALHRRVVRFMEEHAGTDYGEALRRCAG